MLEREYRRELLHKYARSPEDDALLARLLDKYELWQRDGRMQYTRFLTERDKLCCAPVLHELCADDAFFWGGYEGAERTLLLFPAQWQDPEELKSNKDSPAAVIRAAWKSGETLTHRDFLGALMGLGVEREMIGDILPRKGECDILLMREIMSYVLQNLTSAGRSGLFLTMVDAPTLGDERFKLIRDTVATLRLDAVVGCGFGLAREKASAAIRSGKVSIDGLECVKPDKLVSVGCRISLRGLGKIRLEEIGGLSKKGRTQVSIKKFI